MRWFSNMSPTSVKRPNDERSAFDQVVFAVVIGLSLWVACVMVGIEIQNAAAGYYLPRHDLEDGKWRVSMGDIARDRLREVVRSVGLMQYFLAPVVICLAVIIIARRGVWLHWWLAAGGGMVAVTALGMALYRGYYPSLGW